MNPSERDYNNSVSEMPHVAGGSSSPDADLASSDEIKVFSCGDEGDGAEEKSASSDVTPEINELNQLKNSLIDEGENERSKGRHHRQEPASTPSGYIPPSVSSSVSVCTSSAACFVCVRSFSAKVLMRR